MGVDQNLKTLILFGIGRIAGSFMTWADDFDTDNFLLCRVPGTQGHSAGCCIQPRTGVVPAPGRATLGLVAQVEREGAKAV